MPTPSNSVASPIVHRPRRLRGSGALRRLVRETAVEASDLLYPLFVTHGTGIRRPIDSMPGVFHHSVDTLVRECEGVLPTASAASSFSESPMRKTRSARKRMPTTASFSRRFVP